MILLTTLADEAQTPRLFDKYFPNEPKSDASRFAAETRGRPSLPDLPHRPASALNKVERILWMGRDSLSLFSGSASGLKRSDSDRRNDRTECGDLDAVQGNPIVPLSVWFTECGARRSTDAASTCPTWSKYLSTIVHAG